MVLFGVFVHFLGFLSVGLIVNLDAFSELCRVTTETMRGHIRVLNDNPVWLVKRGTRGIGYEIESDGGLAWWQAKRAADDEASAEHQDKLQQLRLDILGDAAGADDELSLSGRQRSEEYAAVTARIKLRHLMGELVERSEIEPILAHAAVDIRRRLMLVPAEYAAQAGISPEEVKPLGVLLERIVNDFVDDFSLAKVKGPSGGA